MRPVTIREIKLWAARSKRDRPKLRVLLVPPHAWSVALFSAPSGLPACFARCCSPPNCAMARWRRRAEALVASTLLLCCCTCLAHGLGELQQRRATEQLFEQLDANKVRLAATQPLAAGSLWPAGASD